MTSIDAITLTPDQLAPMLRDWAAGLYAGEAAVIEKLTSGVIPAALVRTEAGRTRQVRTIDLEPIAREG